MPRNCGLQLGEIERAFMQPARRGGRRDLARRSYSSRPSATLVISPSRRPRSDFEYFDNRIIGDGKVGPMTKRLSELYAQRTSSEGVELA